MCGAALSRLHHGAQVDIPGSSMGLNVLAPTPFSGPGTPLPTRVSNAALDFGDRQVNAGAYSPAAKAAAEAETNRLASAAAQAENLRQQAGSNRDRRRRLRSSSLLASGGTGDMGSAVTGMPSANPAKPNLGS